MFRSNDKKVNKLNQSRAHLKCKYLLYYRLDNINQLEKTLLDEIQINRINCGSMIKCINLILYIT